MKAIYTVPPPSQPTPAFAWHQFIQQLSTAKFTPLKTYPQCKTDFRATTSRKDREYCSAECNSKAQGAKRKARRIMQQTISNAQKEKNGN